MVLRQYIFSDDCSSRVLVYNEDSGRYVIYRTLHDQFIPEYEDIGINDRVDSILYDINLGTSIPLVFEDFSEEFDKIINDYTDHTTRRIRLIGKRLEKPNKEEMNSKRELDNLLRKIFNQ